MSVPEARTAQATAIRPRSPLTAACALRTALERLSCALATPSLDALVASEALLAEALAPFAEPSGSLDAVERIALLDEIDRAGEALARCRRLGRSLQDVARLATGDDGWTTGRGYQTAPPGRAAMGRAVDARA